MTDRATMARYWTHWYERHLAEAEQAKKLAEECGATFPQSSGPSNGQLLRVIEIVRQHPDFDQGGPMADMMDQALRGEVPTLPGVIDDLRAGRKPRDATNGESWTCPKCGGSNGPNVPHCVLCP